MGERDKHFNQQVAQEQNQCTQTPHNFQTLLSASVEAIKIFQNC
jgi:hypothetical protein